MDGVFDRDFIADLRWWVGHDPTTAEHVLRLVEAALDAPQFGLGKPFFMKDRGIGFWGREINRNHLLIYIHFGSYIRFVQCRTHNNES